MRNISSLLVPLAVATGMLLTGCEAKPDSAASEAEAPADISPDALAAENKSDQTNQTAIAEPSVGMGLCKPREEIVFSCRLENQKVASICGMKSAAGATVAQYRYGKRGETPELSWPDANSADRLAFASVPYSGGGEAQLQFRRGNSQYIVYSRVIRTNFKAGEPNDPAIEDGVVVRKGDKTVARHACADPDVMPISYEKAERYAQASADGIVEFEY